MTSRILIAALVLGGCAEKKKDEVADPAPAPAPAPERAREPVVKGSSGTLEAPPIKPEVVTPPPVVDAGVAVAEAPISETELGGAWRGDWGNLYMRADADGTVRGVYDFSLGTITGRLENGVFIGWWCQAPSRKPARDAGDVEFKFTRAADGTLLLDGRWRSGHSGTWHSDWDLRSTDKAPDPTMLARFDEPAAFCKGP